MTRHESSACSAPRHGPWAVAVAVAMLLPAAVGQERSPGGVRTGIFGLEADGNRFVYVFDRSASMGNDGGRPLAAAKRELVRSLDELGDVQQFYVIFYNQRPQFFSPSGVGGRLVFATEDSRRAARRFVESVRASGATRHVDAIAAALRLAPDVVFILTDGDAADDLDEDELRTLTRSLGGARCMVVQFGGEGSGRSPRLARLAAESGGRYAVIDGDAGADDAAAAVEDAGR